MSLVNNLIYHPNFTIEISPFVKKKEPNTRKTRSFDPEFITYLNPYIVTLNA